MVHLLKITFVPILTTGGPRPGLWNQDLLTAERDKYGANDIKPGLTGWAQINWLVRCKCTGHAERGRLARRYCQWSLDYVVISIF